MIRDRQRSTSSSTDDPPAPEGEHRVDFAKNWLKRRAATVLPPTCSGMAIIEHALAQGKAEMGLGAGAAGKSGGDLGTVGMVLHAGGVPLRIGQDAARGIDDGEAHLRLPSLSP